MNIEEQMKSFKDRLDKIQKQLSELTPNIQNEFNKRDSDIRKLREDVDKLLKDVRPYKH